MGVSKLKIPKVCEHCGKAFEARTFNTRFCSSACNAGFFAQAQKAGIRRERKPQIVQENVAAIAEIQIRPYISIAEAVVLCISKDTIRRRT
jgi:hypothetical protein